MSTLKNLPDKWDVKPLGEACKTIKGKKPKNSGPATTERTVPYINIKAFESGQPVEFAAPGNYPTCERDDVLIVWDGARAGLSGRAVPGYIGSTLAKVYSDVADNRYLFYFLQSQYGRINSRTKGVGIPHVDPTIFNNIPFPIAPPEQQKQIVAEIEKQFSRLDEAVANLKHVKANLKRYKAAVLKAAVEGQVGDTQRQHWTATTLGAIATQIRNGFSRKPDADKGARIFRISAVRPLKLDLSDVRYLSGHTNDYADFLVSSGDVLFTRYNGNRDLVGACAVVPDQCPPTIHPDKLIRVKVPDTMLLPSMLVILASVGESRAFLETRIRTTAGQSGISGGDLKSMPVSVPPLTDQFRIVAEVERRISLTEELEAQVNANLTRAERLRQSILTRAFCGHLMKEDSVLAQAVERVAS